MKFTKMHGLGNDFILIDNRSEQVFDYSNLARKMCRRRFDIGADGILVLLPSTKAQVKMRIFNSDGSEAQMCGNGIRCFARYAFTRGIIESPRMTVETLAGIIRPVIINKDPENFLVQVDMGVPRLRRKEIPMTGVDSPRVVDESIQADDGTFLFTAVSMGNPHCVVLVDEITDRHVRHYGPIIEKHPLFPEKTNVEFIQVLTPRHINFRVWERGAGETMACGTGACASVVAGIMKGRLDRKVKVTLPGGDLEIQWQENGRVLMTGPAEESFEGEWKKEPER